MVQKGQDPSTKMLRSSFGSQVKSINASLPAFGFGSSHRDASMKMYLSAEQTKTVPGNNSQGPVYKLYSSVGRQQESVKVNPGTMSFGTSARLPKYGNNKAPGPGAYTMKSTLGEQTVRPTSPKPVFGTSTRDQQDKVYLTHEAMKSYYGKESPAPNTYNVQGAIGRQFLSGKESLPMWGQGTSGRFQYDFIRRAREIPAVGTYGVIGSVGKQPLSVKRTALSAKFGTGTRDAIKKTFISKEHEKVSYGLNSPGPITANARSSMGNQTQSVKLSAPGWGFGTEQRIKAYGNAVPGPGTYYA